MNNTAFEEYTGMTIETAKRLCINEDLDFGDEFWQPFLRYQWIEENSDELDCIFAETGADRELDFNPEAEYDKAYDNAHKRSTNV